MSAVQIDTRDFIVARKRGFIITLEDVQEYCVVDREAARKALVSAFVEGLVQPVYRRIGVKNEWKVHLMAISRLSVEPSDVEVAFLRT